MDYRRAYRPGATYFFTLVTEARRPILVAHLDSLRDAFRVTRKRHPFEIDAIVVLPDHLHAVWTLPEGDSDFSLRWREIKRRYTQSLPSSAHGARSPSRERKGERAIWQRRFWEHLVRDEDDFAAHVDYVHFNPVKHGLVTEVYDWPHSSFHRYVRLGWYPPRWGSGLNIPETAGRE
ncbi:REP-associated tyrosine transposase [Inquilinus sp. CA228]|uniref:REP-associated tyrosine transposase n=1 Tax=Inquilinus sp. CA228 TaxID=3455609 RepID=UPI003F8D125B